MNLEQIQKEWDKDSVMDPHDPEPLTVDQLHSKYWKYLSEDRQVLFGLNQELDALRIAKKQYFLHPTKETAASTKWKYPAANKIIKTEVNEYLAADPDILDLTKRINIIDIRVNFVEDIIKKIHNRGFLIKSHIEWEKYKAGIS